MEELKSKAALAIKNPIIKVAVILFFSLLIGIGALWVLLGICSPVLLSLLILKWN